MSLTGKSSGNCYRTYTPPLEPSSASSVTLTYAFPDKDVRGGGDSLLIYLAGGAGGQSMSESMPSPDFLALEMVDRQIRFIWNAGGGATVLTHPLKLLPSPDGTGGLSDDSRWYKIEAERTGNVASLRVRPVKAADDDSGGGGGGQMEGTTVTGAGPPRFTKMDLTTGNKLYIGRLPDNPPPDIKVINNQFNSIKSNCNFKSSIKNSKTSKLSGHLHQLWLDGQPVGLWNFMTTSSGCSPSIEG